MLNWTGRILTCLFIFCVAGGHWGVMQVTVWSQTASTSSSASFLDAVLESPCESCLTILEGSQKETKDQELSGNQIGPLVASTTDPPRAIFPPALVFLLDDKPQALTGIRLAPAHGPPQGG